MNSKCLWLQWGTDGRVWGSQPQDSSLRAPSPWAGPWMAPRPSVTWGWWGLLGQEEEALRGLGEASRRCNEDTGEGRGARLPGPPSFFPAEAQLTGRDTLGVWEGWASREACSAPEVPVRPEPAPSPSPWSRGQEGRTPRLVGLGGAGRRSRPLAWGSLRSLEDLHPGSECPGVRAWRLAGPQFPPLL